MGGLGNQLFQLAFLHYTKTITGRQSEIEQVSSSIRRNERHEPEISSYNLDIDITANCKTVTRNLFEKLIGLSLRLRLNQNRTWRRTTLYRIAILSAQIIATFKYRKLTTIFISDNIGYVNWKPSKTNQLIVGYFQTYKYLELPEVLEEMSSLSPRIATDDVEKYRLLAEKEKPLLVHIRLGDYRNEPSFGILSEDYYSAAINLQMNRGKYNQIWVFSDEPSYWEDFIPIEYRHLIRVIGSVGNNSVSLLEVMRMCHGFVIANSTLSWWAASLSSVINPLVTYPDPWFEKKENPIKLINDNWIPISREGKILLNSNRIPPETR
jgi:hypothetical protein